MTTPWRGAAPPGQRQDLVKMGRFGRFHMAGLAVFDQKNSIEETTPINTAF